MKYSWEKHVECHTKWCSNPISSAIRIGNDSLCTTSEYFLSFPNITTVRQPDKNRVNYQKHRITKLWKGPQWTVIVTVIMSRQFSFLRHLERDTSTLEIKSSTPRLCPLDHKLPMFLRESLLAIDSHKNYILLPTVRAIRRRIYMFRSMVWAKR